MSQIQSLLESANPYKSLQSDAAKLASKWAKTGLLEGLDETNKNNMSLMLENQAKQLVSEVSQTGTGAFFTPGQGEQWAGIALPLVRKVFGQIAAKEFVSVQPMNLPSGLVFFLDFQYGTDKNPFTKGNSLYGNRGSDTSKYPFSTPAAEGGLYGTGRFTYSTNQFSASYTVASASAVTTASWGDVGFDSAYSASVAAGEIKKITLSALGAVSASMDYDAVRGFLLLSGSVTNAGATAITVGDNIQAFTTVNAANTTLTFYVSASTSEIAPSSAMVLYYNKLTADNTRGDFEADATYAIPNSENATQIEIPEINISMVSSEITAKTKKLKAVWTPEFAQDLNAYQNIDAEAELTNMLSEYISMEIDLEILDMLIEDAAAGTEYWSAINNTVINQPVTNTTLPTTLSSGFYNTQGQWFQTLGTKVQKLSNKIHQLTLRGGANFMVISPTVATIIESIPGFASSNNGEADQMEYAFGVQKVGSFNGRYKVYKNPYMTENVILMGYRGNQFLEAGAVFAPYIPLIMTPLVYDPNTFTPRKGLLTRYAKKMLRPEFYAKIYVNGLNTL
jgi:hypothetical protein